MSYTIVYDSQMIKTSTGYIFTVLHGDNNVWECNNRRRARNWSCWCFNQSEEDIVNYFKSWCGKKYQEHFQLNGKWVNDERLMRWVKNNLKKAKTIDEILEVSPYSIPECSITVYNNSLEYRDPNHRTEELDTHIRSSAAMDDWCKTVQKRKDDKLADEEIYINVSFGYGEPLKLKQTSTPKGNVMLKYKNSYVTEFESNSMSRSPNICEAKIFENYEQAKKVIKDSCWNLCDFRIISADTALVNASKVRDYVVSFGEGHRESYYVKGTKSGFRHSGYVSSAKKMTKKEAEKTIERLKNRGFSNLAFKIKKVS